MRIGMGRERREEVFIVGEELQLDRCTTTTMAIKNLPAGFLLSVVL